MTRRILACLMILVPGALGLAGCQTAPETIAASGAGRGEPAGPAAMVVPAPAMMRPALSRAPDLAVLPQTQFKAMPDSPVSGWKSAADEPVSTFSADVDTASYAFVRRLLSQGIKPQAQAVRIEEMINYFPYGYAGPARRQDGFATHATIVPSPWKPDAKILHIGIQGWTVPPAQRPAAHLTFLVDVSGSMAGADRLPLVQASLRQLVAELRPDDRVALVSYASGTAVVLPPTSGAEKGAILAAIDGLRAGGGTYGAAGLDAAYAQALAMKDKEAVNRVILATDGDFNIGPASPKALEDLVAAKRATGIYLTVLGVGMGNLNDAIAQKLAQAGNGQAAYLDGLQEARKVLVHQLTASVVPIADDVKIQVEFNPARVAEYRLIGYETRGLARADFNDDTVDAGDIGAGHQVTALYEILPVGARGRILDDLRYGAKPASKDHSSQEIAFIKLRHKVPGEQDSRLSTLVVGRGQEKAGLDQADADIRFAVAVAGFGQLLRGQLDAGWWAPTIALAQGARGDDPQGWRAGAVELMEIARKLGP